MNTETLSILAMSIGYLVVVSLIILLLFAFIAKVVELFITIFKPLNKNKRQVNKRWEKVIHL